MNTNLNSRAMLVAINISQWSARKHDKKVTNEVHVQHQAAADAGRYNKLLVAKARIDEITKATNALRAEHYKLTLPWKDDGYRILPAAAFDEYSEKIRKLRGEWEQRVAEFVADYPLIVAEARVRLNGLFNEGDYPREASIGRRFNVETDIKPIPTAGDFRVDLGDEMTAKIKARIDADAEATLKNAMKDVWNRLYDAVHSMAERLSSDRAGKAPIFRDSLVENLQEITKLLPKLNLTGDAKLEELRQQVEQKLCSTSPETLRASAVVRKSQAAEAQAICDLMAGFMGEAPAAGMEWTPAAAA